MRSGHSSVEICTIIRGTENKKKSKEVKSLDFFCVKCKAHKNTEPTREVVSKNNMRMAKAVCPDCGTNLNRIIGKA